MLNFRIAVLFLIFLALRMFNARRSKNQKPPCAAKIFRRPKKRDVDAIQHSARTVGAASSRPHTRERNTLPYDLTA